MKIIDPLKIWDNDLLTSSTAYYSEYSKWDSDESYDKEDRVYEGKYVYESLTDSNDTKPSENTEEEVGSEDATWLEVDAVNEWKMFDEIIATQTEADDESDGTLEVVVSPDSIADSVAAFNISASKATVEVVNDSDDRIDYKEFNLTNNEDVVNWWHYFYEPVIRNTEFVTTGMVAANKNDQIIVTLQEEDTDAQAKCGQLVIGKFRELGSTLYGTEVGIEDFSTVDRDEFGRATITKRRYSQIANYDIALPSSRVRVFQRQLAKYRATPIVFIGSEDYPETIVYGFYRDFRVTIEGPSISDAFIEVEGLV